ncbi:hypothetical protein CEE36_08465 [candidate division TA06 bacterium B3_TA06]|uniref:Uncharacterized protein n=1 Tax=candidate division TA06 bacterium B3_TA06 TaxID=2012487 RepID=A0A532V2E8_UNCT6|nr:MAG: hypothetical protein CEE36_08465 [candidate division TA06 bacterium B3_TA06]
MAKDQPKFLAVLPWLRLAEEIEVGPFTFWRWPKDRNKYVNKPLIGKIEDTLHAHFRETGYSFKSKKWSLDPCKSLCIASHRKRYLKRGLWFKEEDFECFRMAVDSLCLSTLFQTDIVRTSIESQKPTISYIRSYNNYTDFNWHGIQLGTEVTARQLRTRYGSRLIGEFPPIPVIKPRECTDDEVKGDDSLLSSLGKLLKSPLNTFTRRIFRALAQFNSAYTDYPLGSILAEVVILATAFEILLDIRKRNKTEELSQKIEELFAKNQQIQEPDTGKSWKVYWMRQFYRLRNKVAHGKEIHPEDLDWTTNPYAGRHMEIAIYIFRLVLMKLLVRRGIHEETDLDIYQSNKLDEFLSTEMESFPRETNLDFVSWQAEKQFGSD